MWRDVLWNGHGGVHLLVFILISSQMRTKWESVEADSAKLPTPLKQGIA